MIDETKLFRCNCGSMEHHFTMTYWPDDYPGERFIYVKTYLFTFDNIFKRARAAIKYVFGYKCKYGHWDEVLLDREKTQELVRYLLDYEASFSEPQEPLTIRQVKARHGETTVRPEFPVVYEKES